MDDPSQFSGAVSAGIHHIGCFNATREFISGFTRQAPPAARWRALRCRAAP
jgi:hypothetical protein